MWTKLEKRNSFGMPYYVIPGEPKSQWGTCDSSDGGLEFQAGQKFSIIWPTGGLEIVAIAMGPISVWIDSGAMGVPADHCNRPFPCILSSINGVPVRMPLDDLQFDVQELAKIRRENRYGLPPALMPPTSV